MGYEVIELCPHCKNEVIMQWEVEKHGFKSFCPYCGNILMICSEYLKADGKCNYDSKTDSCMFKTSTQSCEAYKDYKGDLIKAEKCIYDI